MGETQGFFESKMLVWVSQTRRAKETEETWKQSDRHEYFPISPWSSFADITFHKFGWENCSDNSGSMMES